MRSGTLKAISVASLLLLQSFGGALAQQSAAEICSAPDKRQTCSVLCCGRRSCPPSCEVDCVKACVDACASPASMDNFMSRVKQLQIRCGNRSVR